MNKLTSATWLLGLTMLGSSAAHAYTPPIGIPAPSFGIDETAPAQPAAWPSGEAAGFYYVDKSHPSATDTGNSYGYPNKPRLTIPRTTFGPGAYIELHGGEYSGSLGMLTFDCRKENPCWLRGASASVMPTISGNFTLDATYLIVENLDFNGGTGGSIDIVSDSTYVSVRHSKFRNRAFVSNTAAIGITPALGKKSHDIVAYKNEFSALGDYTATVDLDFHAINPTLWGRDSTTELFNVWALENHCYRLSGDCVQVNAGNWTDSYKYLHHVYIGKNVGHEGRQGPFGVKQSSDVIISQNTAYGSRQHGPQAGNGIGFQYGPNNLWIIFNDISDSNYGIRQTDTSTPFPNNKIYIVGNVIHNIHPEASITYNPNDAWRPGVAISLWHGNLQRFIVDNTIYDVHGGITAIYDGPLTISNNIISNIHDQDYHLYIAHPARPNPTADASIDSGLFYDPELGNAKIRWEGGNGDLHNTLTSFKAAYGLCADCSVGNPDFLDPANGKFDLQKTSAAINKGKDQSVYDTFFSLYGINIEKDFHGQSRKIGLKQDFGAFEVGLAPTAPSNFTVK